jgi:hypothetical protein
MNQYKILSDLREGPKKLPRNSHEILKIFLNGVLGLSELHVR